MSFQNLVLTRIVMPALFRKGRYADRDRACIDVKERAGRPVSHEPPKRLRRDLLVAETDHDGWPVYELTPLSKPPALDVVYFHGGSYVAEISAWQWSLAGYVADSTPARVIVPIYPRGDAIGPAATVAQAAAITRNALEQAGERKVALVGDSAGGGLALAVAQALRDEGRRIDRIVLISPWLDVATDEPEQYEIEARDRMLSICWSQEAGRLYARDLPLDDPLVSPIYGEMRGLPPLIILTGTDDILLVDSRRLRGACKAAGVPVEYIEAPGMPHGYPLLPTPEGRAARARMVQALRC